jgi:hypothetical protein
MFKAALCHTSQAMESTSCAAHALTPTARACCTEQEDHNGCWHAHNQHQSLHGSAKPTFKPHLQYTR